MTIDDFLFWLVSLEIAPKRRHMFWEQGMTLTNEERTSFMKTVVQKYQLMKPNAEVIARLKGVKSITILENIYPEQLKNTAQPPLVLFYAGDVNLLQKPNIAIVGSRRHSQYGQWLVETWVPELVKEGYVTMSGAAQGIDGIAHRTTMKSRGHTIAVLGHGLSFVYPKQHRQLLSDICCNGLVLTEYAPWVGPKSWHFPARNRIVVGLSQNVWVVEAAAESGSMVSAKIATDENRQIWCIPGDIDRVQSQGTNQLIQDGANVALTVKCIIGNIE